MPYWDICRSAGVKWKFCACRCLIAGVFCLPLQQVTSPNFRIHKKKLWTAVASSPRGGKGSGPSRRAMGTGVSSSQRVRWSLWTSWPPRWPVVKPSCSWSACHAALTVTGCMTRIWPRRPSRWMEYPWRLSQIKVPVVDQSSSGFGIMYRYIT